LKFALETGQHEGATALKHYAKRRAAALGFFRFGVVPVAPRRGRVALAWIHALPFSATRFLLPPSHTTGVFLCP